MRLGDGPRARLRFDAEHAREALTAERRNRNDVPRRVIVETLILGGLRVSELCGLDGPHIDRS